MLVGLNFCGDELRRFCREKNLATSSSFWQKKIYHDFGEYCDFLLPKGKVELTESGYFHLQTAYDHLLNSAEEYFVTVKDKHHTLQFNLVIPEPTLQGIALAVFIANLPINLQSIGDSSEVIDTNTDYLAQGSEIDLNDLGESLVLTSDQEVTIDDLESDLESLSQLTLLLSNGIEEVAITGVNALTIQGFMTAFEWARDLELYGKIYRPITIGPNWRHYLLAAYKIEDESLAQIDLAKIV